MGSFLFLSDLLTGHEPHAAGNHGPPKAVPIPIAASLRPPRLCASLAPPSKEETGARAEPQRARRKNASEPRMDTVGKPAGVGPRIAPLLGVFKGPLLETGTPSGTRGAKATAIARMRFRFMGSGDLQNWMHIGDHEPEETFNIQHSTPNIEAMPQIGATWTFDVEC